MGDDGNKNPVILRAIDSDGNPADIQGPLCLKIREDGLLESIGQSGFVYMRESDGCYRDVAGTKIYPQQIELS